MARLDRSTSKYDLIVKSDTDTPIYLKFDRHKFKSGQFKYGARYLPLESGDPTSIPLRDWTWSNGTGGAGTTIETPASYEAGACEYGENVWLRRLGAAQPAGRRVELTLPTGTAALTSGQFTAGSIYNGDLYISTLRRYIVKVPNAAGSGTLTERDAGASAQTVGTAVFSVGGTGKLYVGATGVGIQAYDGSSWTTGQAGTERGWLDSVYWTLGDSLATGGLAGTAGTGAQRLGGTNPTGTGFYHVVADPTVAANWSAIAYIGTGGLAFPTQRTVSGNRWIAFATGNGVYTLDEAGNSPNIAKWMELAASVNSGAAVAYWAGMIFYCHEQGLVALTLDDGARVDVARFVQFGSKAGTTPMYGRPLALAPSPDGLYVGYYDAETTTSYIGCLVMDPGGGFRWSMAEAVIDGEIVTYLQQAVTPTGEVGLFIGTVRVSDSTLHLYRQDVPRSGDPESDVVNGYTGFTPTTDWSLRLSRFNGGRPIPNTFRRWMVEADYLGSDYADNTVDVQVAADGGTFATQGTATTSPRWSAGPTAAYVDATSAQIKLVVHNAADAPVVIRSVGARYSPRPELTKVYDYPVIFGTGVTGQDPKVVLSRLEYAQREGPVQITDKLGRTYDGIIEPGLAETYTEETGKFVCHVDLTISVVRDAARWDQDVFDAASFS